MQHIDKDLAGQVNTMLGAESGQQEEEMSNMIKLIKTKLFLEVMETPWELHTDYYSASVEGVTIHEKKDVHLLWQELDDTVLRKYWSSLSHVLTNGSTAIIGIPEYIKSLSESRQIKGFSLTSRKSDDIKVFSYSAGDSCCYKGAMTADGDVIAYKHCSEVCNPLKILSKQVNTVSWSLGSNNSNVLFVDKDYPSNSEIKLNNIICRDSIENCLERLYIDWITDIQFVGNCANFGLIPIEDIKYYGLPIETEYASLHRVLSDDYSVAERFNKLVSALKIIDPELPEKLDIILEAGE